VCQGDFSTKSWVCLWAFSAGSRGVFGVEVEWGRFQTLDEACQAVLRLIGAHRFLPIAFLLFTNVGRRSRDGLDHDEGDHYQEKHE